MLVILQSRRILRLSRPGRLLPWLGPALRGLVAGRFRSAVCQHSALEQQTTWRHCKGCPLMQECPYGQTFESDPPDSAEAFSGQSDGVRPIVLAPDFPVATTGRPGLAVPLTVTFLGRTAALNAVAFWDVLAKAVSDPEAGIGSDGVLFELEREHAADHWRLLELPLAPTALSGVLLMIKVELTSPLLLRQGAQEGRRRQMVHNPSFADLLRASLRTLGPLCRYYGQAVNAEFKELRAAAEEVPMLQGRFRGFRQEKHSERKGQWGVVHGVVGEAVYGPVPAALVRWLVAAGRVHVGLHRVAGAGGWRVSWSPDRGATWCEID